MDNRRAIIWSAAAAVFAAFFYYMSIDKAVDNRVGDLDKKTVILKAIRDIPANTRIDQSMFIQELFPQAYLPPKAAERARDVIGQVALATIFEGEPILTSKLVPFDETSIDRRIPEGMRAITVGIRDDQDVVGVGGNLRPGNFIDILVTHYMSTKEIEKGRVSGANVLSRAAESLKSEVRTVFQNIKIIAVGQDLRLATADIARSAAGIARKDTTNKNVTVAMTPADAQKLVLAQQTGRLTLVLRRFNDTEIVNLDYLDPFKAFGIKLPVVQGPPPAYREIKGGQVFASPY